MSVAYFSQRYVTALPLAKEVEAEADSRGRLPAITASHIVLHLFPLYPTPWYVGQKVLLMN
jgi:hypothetical protein